MPPSLAHIDTWIFDLDNTLYPATSGMFAQIDVRMGAYIQRLLKVDAVEAKRVQKAMFHAHGLTLKGLMHAHGVDPHDFLGYVHDLELDALAQDRRVIDGIARLPGRKLVFTNSDDAFAGRVLARLGLTDAFEAVHDIHAGGYLPKPDPAAYARLCEHLGVDPLTAVFVEDMAGNLKPAHALGMTTVWLNNGSERGGHGADSAFIDLEISDLGEWLDTLASPLREGHSPPLPLAGGALPSPPLPLAGGALPSPPLPLAGGAGGGRTVRTEATPVD